MDSQCPACSGPVRSRHEYCLHCAAPLPGARRSSALLSWAVSCCAVADMILGALGIAASLALFVWSASFLWSRDAGPLFFLGAPLSIGLGISLGPLLLLGVGLWRRWRWTRVVCASASGYVALTCGWINLTRLPPLATGTWAEAGLQVALWGLCAGALAQGVVLALAGPEFHRPAPSQGGPMAESTNPGGFEAHTKP